MTTTLEGGEGSASRPGRSLPPGKTRYPLYRRLGGPQGRSGQVRKISSPPGFDSRIVQPVASYYTDYANRRTLALEPPVYLVYEEGYEFEAHDWQWTKTDILIAPQFFFSPDFSPCNYLFLLHLIQVIQNCSSRTSGG